MSRPTRPTTNRERNTGTRTKPTEAPDPVPIVSRIHSAAPGRAILRHHTEPIWAYTSGHFKKDPFRASPSCANRTRTASIHGVSDSAPKEGRPHPPEELPQSRPDGEELTQKVERMANGPREWANS